MGDRLRLMSRTLASAGCYLPLMLSAGCGSPEPHADPFVGAFAYEEGSRVSASCEGTRVTHDIDGMQVEIVRAADGVELISGPRCSVPLAIHGDTARTEGNAPCDLAVALTVATAMFSELSVRVDAGRLHLRGAGRADLIVPDAAHLPCEEFTIVGTLSRRDE